MKKYLSITLALIMVFGLVACAEPAAQTTEPEAQAPVDAAPTPEPAAPVDGGDAGNGRKLVAFSQGEFGNSWRATNTEDMEEWALRSGFDYIYTNGDNDARKQLSDIEDLLARNPDILIVAPLQADAITPAVEMARNAGVPLITIDREVNAEPDGVHYVAKIVQDFVEVGRLGGHRTVEFLTELYGEPRGRVLEISGTIGASPAIDQGNGIREVLDQYPDIEIVDSQTGNYDRATSRTVMDDFLVRHPEGTIDILIVHCDDAALGALQAMRDAGREDLVGRIISKNGMRTALEEVISGAIDVTYACPPRFGEVTMDLVIRFFAGDPIDLIINVPFETFDMRENRALTEERFAYLTEHNLDF